MSAALLAKGANHYNVQNLFAVEALMASCDSSTLLVQIPARHHCISPLKSPFYVSVCVLGLEEPQRGWGLNPPPCKNKALSNPHNVRRPQIRDLLFLFKLWKITKHLYTHGEEERREKKHIFALSCVSSARRSRYWNIAAQTCLSLRVRLLTLDAGRNFSSGIKRGNFLRLIAALQSNLSTTLPSTNLSRS